MTNIYNLSVHDTETNGSKILTTDSTLCTTQTTATTCQEGANEWTRHVSLA